MRMTGDPLYIIKGPLKQAGKTTISLYASLYASLYPICQS